jgi:hypothetical protein
MIEPGRVASEVRLEEVHLLVRKNGQLYRIRLPAAELEAAFAKREAKGRYVGTFPEPPRVRLLQVDLEGELVGEDQLAATSLDEGGGGETGPVCAKMADCSIICWS